MKTIDKRKVTIPSSLPPPPSLEPSPQWVAIRRMSKTCHEIDGAEKTLDDDEEEEEAGS